MESSYNREEIVTFKDSQKNEEHLRRKNIYSLFKQYNG